MTKVKNADLGNVILECMEYVLEESIDDFLDNPSREHLYYRTLKLYAGEQEAEKHLFGAMKPVAGEQ